MPFVTDPEWCADVTGFHGQEVGSSIVFSGLRRPRFSAADRDLGFPKSIVAAPFRVVGAHTAMLSIVMSDAMLTMAACRCVVSLRCIVRAGCSARSEFKRLLPGRSRRRVTFTMGRPGTPQIQKSFRLHFSAPQLADGATARSAEYLLIIGMMYRNRVASRRDRRGYGDKLLNEPGASSAKKNGPPVIAIEVAAGRPEQFLLTPDSVLRRNPSVHSSGRFTGAIVRRSRRSCNLGPCKVPC